MENVNYTAPVGEIRTPMTAPSNFDGKTKRTDIQLLPNGPHPAVIYSLVGLGTHQESFNNGPMKDIAKIHVGFEFPQLKQFFYEEDTEMRSTVMSVDGAFNMSGKSKLRAIVEAVTGRPFKDDTEAYNFDISSILGAKVLVNVTTKNRKADGTPYNAVQSVIPMGAFPLPANFNPELEKLYFTIDDHGQNFRTINYAKLPFFLKKTILASNEAKKYASQGGQFAKLESTTQNAAPQQKAPQQQAPQQQAAPVQQQQQQLPPKPAPAANPGQPTFVFTDTEFTLEQWKHAGYTEDALVANGKGYWSTPQPPKPQGPPTLTPSQPAPAPAPAPAQPVQAQPQQQTAEEWLTNEDDDMPF